MDNSNWKTLENLIAVAGHAVYVADDYNHIEDDGCWWLQPFQKGEPRFYIEHIETGVQTAVKDEKALLVFSGGQTRRQAGPKSEAESYFAIAKHKVWWGTPEVENRATLEEFARDSFENLLFAICRFYEATGKYPQHVTVVGWKFKEPRFKQHREAIGFPEEHFNYLGVNNPINLAECEASEAITSEAFCKDSYGKGDFLNDKKNTRNPFNQQHVYAAKCPELKGLLEYWGTSKYSGKLPWN
jgi:hypothetical protein